jgi:hypothetical protein
MRDEACAASLPLFSQSMLSTLAIAGLPGEPAPVTSPVNADWLQVIVPTPVEKTALPLSAPASVPV